MESNLGCQLVLRFQMWFIMTVYYKMREILLQNATAILLQNATAILFQNATEIYYKLRQVFYYKMRQLLQNETFTTNWDSTEIQE